MSGNITNRTRVSTLTPLRDTIWNFERFLMPFLWALWVAFRPVWFFCCTNTKTLPYHLTISPYHQTLGMVTSFLSTGLDGCDIYGKESVGGMSPELHPFLGRILKSPKLKIPLSFGRDHRGRVWVLTLCNPDVLPEKTEKRKDWKGEGLFKIRPLCVVLGPSTELIQSPPLQLLGLVGIDRD